MYTYMQYHTITNYGIHVWSVWVGVRVCANKCIHIGEQELFKHAPAMAAMCVAKQVYNLIDGERERERHRCLSTTYHNKVKREPGGAMTITILHICGRTSRTG